MKIVSPPWRVQINWTPRQIFKSCYSQITTSSYDRNYRWLFRLNRDTERTQIRRGLMFREAEIAFRTRQCVLIAFTSRKMLGASFGILFWRRLTSFIFRFLISWLHQFNVLRKTKQGRLNNRKWIVISRWKMRHFIEEKVDVKQHQENVIVHWWWRVESITVTIFSRVTGDLQNLKHLKESFVMFWFFSNIIQYKFIQSMVAYHCFCFNNIAKERHEEICHTIYSFNMHFSSGFFISIKARQRDIEYSTNACSTQVVL